jgi:hypothetical protein
MVSSRPRKRTLCLKSFCLIGLLAGCGVEVGNPKNPDPVILPPATIFMDAEVAVEAISGAVEDLFEAAGETFSLSPSLNLAPPSAEQTLSLSPSLNLAPPSAESGRAGGLSSTGPQRNCEVTSDGAVKVSRIRKDHVNQRMGRQGGGVWRTSTLNHVHTMVYYSDTGVLSCNADETAARIDLNAAFSLRVETSVDKSTSSVLKKQNEDQILRNYSTTLSSRRRADIEKQLNEAGQLVMRKVLSYESSTTTRLTRRNGQSVTLESTLQVGPDHPFIIETLYDGKHEELRRHIKSGVAVSHFKNGNVLWLQYHDLVVAPQQDCVPLSGTITGTMLETAESMTPLKTYTIDFTKVDDKGTVLIAFGDGSQQKMIFDACVLPEQ